jgi:manganese efflux pump family protein
MPIAAASTDGGPLSVITLITWMLTASIGAYMLATVIGRDGLRQQRTVRDGLPPGVLFGHFGLALTGLAVWASFVATGWVPLAWSAVGLLMPAFGLGICTVTLWTPFPGPLADPDGAGSPHGVHGTPVERAATGRLTDEVFARALTDDVLASRLVEEVIARAPAEPPRAGRKRRGHTAAVIPLGHGMAAVATFALAVVTAASTR